jgi:hypothetical protein
MKRSWLLLAATPLAGLAACTSYSTPSPTSAIGTLSGQVLAKGPMHAGGGPDSRWFMTSGSTVSVTPVNGGVGQRTTTDQDGRFHVDLRPGVYSVRVTCGISSATDVATVSVGVNTERHLRCT